MKNVIILNLQCLLDRYERKEGRKRSEGREEVRKKWLAGPKSSDPEVSELHLSLWLLLGSIEPQQCFLLGGPVGPEF